MVAQGNSSDTPPRAIFKQAQKLVFNDKLWGVADMPSISFPFMTQEAMATLPPNPLWVWIADVRHRVCPLDAAYCRRLSQVGDGLGSRQGCYFCKQS